MDTGNKTLKKFGRTMSIVFGVIFCTAFLKYRQANYWFLSVSAVFFTLGALLPSALNPVYILWMKLAEFLGWVNSRLILLVIFYLLMAPIGLIMRLFGIDALERGIHRGESSYWKQKEEKGFDLQHYERQF